jgi:hypothetical protein
MIDATVAAGVPFAWFTADEEFGQNPGLRNHLQAAGISYVMAVPKNTTFIDPTGKQIKLSDLAPKLNHTTWRKHSAGLRNRRWWWHGVMTGRRWCGSVNAAWVVGQMGAGCGGIQGRPMIASRRTVIALRPCLTAVDR